MSDFKIYLAPFQGITTDVFMNVYTRHFQGIDKLFTAFFSGVQREKSLNPKVHQLHRRQYNHIPVVPQILSKETDEIVRFATICKQYGYQEINWNMGCPFPRVANKKRGSGLLPHPELVQEILEKAVPLLPLKLSIKCRLGYHAPDEILTLISLFNRFSLSEIIIHARIGKQMYKGDVDLDSFSKAFNDSQNPVSYNGDIFSADRFQQLKETFPAISRWMMGRGMLADPFLPADCKGIFITEERKPLVRRFVDDLYFGYRKEMNDRLQAINRMKELWSYLALSFDKPDKVFNLLKKTKSFGEYEAAVNRVFVQYHWQGEGGKGL